MAIWSSSSGSSREFGVAAQCILPCIGVNPLGEPLSSREAGLGGMARPPIPGEENPVGQQPLQGGISDPQLLGPRPVHRHRRLARDVSELSGSPSIDAKISMGRTRLPTQEDVYMHIPLPLYVDDSPIPKLKLVM